MNARELEDLIRLYKAIKSTELSISEFIEYIENIRR